MRVSTTAIVFASMVSSSVAFAQDGAVTEYVPDGEIKQIENEKRQGFDGTLQANATVNLVSNSNVVGQTDGLATLLGLGLLAGLDYVYKKHEVRNTLRIDEAWARTPVIDEFVKSDDLVSLESLYNYFFIDWMGAFARLNLESALFKSEAITAAQNDYAIARPDGTIDTQTTDRLPLSKSFQPLTFNQSVGLFAEPVQTEPFRLSTRLGFGLRETWAQDVLVIQDDAATAPIEVRDISNPNSGVTVFQGGLEGFLGIGGVLQGKRVSYDVGASLLIPFINNDPQDRSATDLIRVGVGADVNFAIFEWMSIAYKLRLVSDPQLVEGLQAQNNLLLTFNYTFIDRTEPDAPPEPTEAELEAEAAKQRADEAEQRAAEAEKRAAELEAKLAEPPPEPPVQPEPEPQPEPETDPQPEPQPE